MSLLKANSVQVGQSATASQNFVVTTGVDGTAKIARGNSGATTQDILTVDAAGRVAIPQGMAARTDTVSMVRLTGSLGFGSTNTVIRRFAASVTNQGADITFADSVTLGASFTINTNGVYAIGYTEGSTIATDIGLSLNSSQLTTAIAGITAADRLAMTTTGNANYRATVNSCLYLPAGSVVRPHCNGNGVSSPDNCQFTIVRVS